MAEATQSSSSNNPQTLPVSENEQKRLLNQLRRRNRNKQRGSRPNKISSDTFAPVQPGQSDEESQEARDRIEGGAQANPETGQRENNSEKSTPQIGQPRTTTKDPSMKDRLARKAGDRIGDDISQQEKNSQPQSRIGKAAEQKALKRGLGQARSRGVGGGVEALVRGEGAAAAVEAGASGALAAKKFQQFKMVLTAVKGGSALSGWGIVLLVATWIFQFIIGNVLGREKWKLGGPEKFLAGTLTLVVGIIFILVIFTFFYVLWALGNPLGAFFESVFG